MLPNAAFFQNVIVVDKLKDDFTTFQPNFPPEEVDTVAQETETWKSLLELSRYIKSFSSSQLHC